MGSFSQEFLIRQVTPIIHFQFDEAGATLRATELKPKLDRFLCGRYQEEQGETVPKAWQIAGAPGNDGRSDYYHLNYKAQVIVNGTPEIIPENHTYLKFNRKTGQESEKVDRHFPMYFGNMGNDDAKAPKESGENKRGDKHGVFCPEGLTLKITCLISDKAQREALLTFIGNNLELFFLTHNFGTRQTKGYGGFLYLPEHPLGDQLALLQKVYPSFIYFQLGSTIRCEKTPVFESAKNPPEWAKNADLVYMAMKTGRNRRTDEEFKKGIEDNYVKGYLMTYDADKAGNDKAMMKGAFQVGRTKDRERPQKVKPGQYRFKRALLGLTDNYEFRGTADKARKPIPGATITVSHNERDEKRQIVRFPSPVLVKVLPNAVCFLPEDAGPILDKEFAFQCRGHKEVISTPAAFDTAEFLGKFADWYNDKGYAKNASDTFIPGSLRDSCSKIWLHSVGGEQT